MCMPKVRNTLASGGQRRGRRGPSISPRTSRMYTHRRRILRERTLHQRRRLGLARGDPGGCFNLITDY